MKKLIIMLFVLISFQSFGQGVMKNISLQIGAVCNTSYHRYEITTVGIFVEPNYMLNEKFRLGLRIEPTAVFSGMAVDHTDDGLSYERGSQFLFNNYLKIEYMIGKPKYGTNKVRRQGYIGINPLLLIHKRYIDTYTSLGEWEESEKIVTNFGLGARLGLLLGNFDLSASFNKTGKDFADYFGFNLGCQFSRSNSLSKKIQT